MNIENMNHEQKMELLLKLNKSLGFYPILVISTDDVREHLKDSIEDDIPEEALHNACAYVARKYETGNDFVDAIEWASELCLQHHEKT
jgi:hypothetical protein